MVVKVRGLKAAKFCQALMERETGVETPIERDPEETERIYWVSNTHLTPYGEQLLLDGIPRGTLLWCRRMPAPPPLSAPKRTLSPRTVEALRKLAAEIPNGRADLTRD